MLRSPEKWLRRAKRYLALPAGWLRASANQLLGRQGRRVRHSCQERLRFLERQVRQQREHQELPVRAEVVVLVPLD